MKKIFQCISGIDVTSKETIKYIKNESNGKFEFTGKNQSNVLNINE